MLALDLSFGLARRRFHAWWCRWIQGHTDPAVTPSKPCLPLMVTLVPLGALSLTSRVAGACSQYSSPSFAFGSSCGRMARTLAGVVEVFVDELCRPLAQFDVCPPPPRLSVARAALSGIAYIVGSFAEVAECRDGNQRRERALGLVLCRLEQVAHVFGARGRWMEEVVDPRCDCGGAVMSGCKMFLKVRESVCYLGRSQGAFSDKTRVKVRESSQPIRTATRTCHAGKVTEPEARTRRSRSVSSS